MDAEEKEQAAIKALRERLQRCSAIYQIDLTEFEHPDGTPMTVLEAVAEAHGILDQSEPGSRMAH